MKNYRGVWPNFWTGETGKRLRAAGPEAQLVALYLITNTHSNPLGLYYLPELLISHETALNEKGASKGLRRASEGGFCAYDSPSEVVWVYEMAKFQIGDNLKENDNRVKWVNEQFASLPKNPFLLGFFKKYATAYHLIETENIKGLRRGSEGGIEAPSKPDTDTDTDTDIEDSTNVESFVEERDDAVWVSLLIPDIVRAYHQILSPPLPAALVNGNGYPQSEDLQAQLNARVREYKPDSNGIVFWEGLFTQIRLHMPHLIGVNDRGWKASLHWIAGKKNMAKIINGNFVAGKPVSRNEWATYCEKLKFLRGECIDE